MVSGGKDVSIEENLKPSQKDVNIKNKVLLNNPDAKTIIFLNDYSRSFKDDKIGIDQLPKIQQVCPGF